MPLKNTTLLIMPVILATTLSCSFRNIDITTHDVPELTKQSELVSKGVLPTQTQAPTGAGSGVDIDSQGNIFFLHRSGYGFNNNTLIDKDVVTVYSPVSHEIIGNWGANQFKSPHGITIDDNDHVWITDIKLNKVYQFDPSGKLLKTFGQNYPFYMEACLKVRNLLKNLPCGQNEYTFARPTDVEVFSDGSFVVSDGYRNSRIVKFAQDGTFQWEVSKLGKADSEFYLPHDLAKDADDNIYVADRRNARIQIFSNQGEWKRTLNFPELGRPYGLDISKDNYLYVADGGDSYEFESGEQRSQILKLTLEGDIVDRYSDFGQSLGKLDLPHDIAVNDLGRIFVAEVKNNRLQFFDQRID
ncbi:peptidyl-alpha-hydroxyglycine alpha-amidating lyase family protein [Veronia nyctiphanis]|nr:peptidyl-alpha-hydroxyglycine alpha-amidating lyase family protein [Veronia nyctiphanis]